MELERMYKLNLARIRKEYLRQTGFEVISLKSWGLIVSLFGDLSRSEDEPRLLSGAEVREAVARKLSP